MSDASPRILLSGASGLLGSAVRHSLATQNQPVLQLVRRSVSSPDELHWNPAGDPPFPAPGPLQNLAAAIHLSGSNVAAHRWTPAYKQQLTSSRVDSTRVLATTLARLRQPPKAFLVASATGIYGNRADQLLDEQSAPGSGFLAELCQQWEAAAQPAVDAGIRVVHLRFGVVLGPASKSHPGAARRGALAKMLPIFRLGLGGPLGSGRQWMSWISLQDAVAAILFALQTPSLAGPVNLTAPNPVTNAEFTRTLARQLPRPAFFAAPAFALRLALGEMADEALLSSARVLPAKLTAAGFQFTHPTIDLALSVALAQQPRALS
ncbi:MAG: TIGR01777 family oxidoreductase [Terracidiphilus sp.]|jgi:uncharacterized protein (TIGR01777 family)